MIDKGVDGTPYYAALERIIRSSVAFATVEEKAASVTALDVVEFTVALLEDEPLFNAGKGAVFCADGYW